MIKNFELQDFINAAQRVKGGSCKPVSKEGQMSESEKPIKVRRVYPSRREELCLTVEQRADLKYQEENGIA